MNYLSRIVFINSAAVQYADIDLDGNVHFTGTQGVGKSTLLRAILFFYNADKIKLGIPREKQSFDEYYFPYQNSYIIYEVRKDKTAYCILAYKTNGKTAFRFFDSPYKQDIFIGADNQAKQSWGEIRDGLGRYIHYSRLVASYMEFRQIIYGDNKRLPPEFRKYGLLSSKQYQNIPLTIQNVFLNAKLEAQFIKDTIIKSLSEEEFSIDLENYLRNHLADFESEIKDVNLWFETDKRGVFWVRKQGEKVVDTYRKLNFLKGETQDLGVELRSRMAFVERQTPEIQSELNREQKQLQLLDEDRKKLKELHQKREQNIISEIDYLRKQLNTSKKKEEIYRVKNIFEIIKKVDEKEQLLNSKNRLVSEREVLTAKFADIEQRFQTMLRQLRNELQQAENERDKNLNKIDQAHLVEVRDLNQTYDALLEGIKSDHQEELDALNNQKQDIVRQENQLRNKQAELKYKLFYEDEIKVLENSLAHLEKELFETSQKLEGFKIQKKNIQEEGKLISDKITHQHQLKIDQLSDRKTNTEIQLKIVSKKIDAYQKSLYSWLDQNKKGWENNIGKVLDEGVLFMGNLSPVAREGEQQNLFGIDIDLDAIQRSVGSLEQLRQDQTDLDKELQTIGKTIQNMQRGKEEELARIQKRFKRSLSKIDDNRSISELNLDRFSRKAEQQKVALEELKTKSEKSKEEAYQNVEKGLGELAAKRLTVEEDSSKLQRSIRQKIGIKIGERDREIAEIERQKKKDIEDVINVFDFQKKKVNNRIDDLKKQKSTELSEQGADTERINQVEGLLSDLDNQLAFISRNETLVIEYRKDKREFFDQVSGWRQEKSSLELKLKNIGETHREEQEKADLKFENQRKLMIGLQNNLDEFQSDQGEFEDFKKTEIFQSLSDVSDPAESLEATRKAINIIVDLRGKYYETKDTLDALKRAVQKFTGNFSKNNIFKFAVEFQEDRQYRDFAINLKEFLEEDKIKEYEKRVNERFAHIIQLIGKETNELLSKEGEIDKIIRKINADFKEKNFVQAIKDMEMRTQKSTNPVVKLLTRIREFNDENNLSLGAPNLFNQSGDTTHNKRAVGLLTQLVKELERYKKDRLSLSESFDLQFRIVENDNDSGWVEKLSNVGSEGTDVLVKAMINIMLLNVFKKEAAKSSDDFKLHCMMDEIGRLHPTNVRGILRFANERNIFLINGSPVSQSAMDYKYTYKLSKYQSPQNPKRFYTRISRLIKVNPILPVR